MNDGIALSGNLKFVTLPDVFQILGGSNCTGVLKLTTRYSPNTGIIYFLNGNPVNATNGSTRGLDALYSLFGWIDGEYLFYEDDVSHVEKLIKKGRMEIVLDALRLLDDGKIKKTGPKNHPDIDSINTNDRDGGGASVTRGPLTDYLYVVREDFFRDGDRIVNEGKHGKWIWTVYQGVVKVTRETRNGPLTIARLGEGCFIGTLRALLFGEYERNATVTAEGDVRLCLLDADPFYHEYSKLSPDFRRLLLSLDRRLRKLNDRAVELFSSEDGKPERTFPSGRTNKLDIERSLYKILEGGANLVKKDSKGVKHILTLEENDVMGNIPFIDFGHEPQSAMIIPSDNLKTDTIDIQVISGEYENLSRTFKNLIFNIGTYLSKTTDLVCRLYAT